MTLLEALEQVAAARKANDGAIDAMVMMIEAEQERRQDAEHSAAQVAALAGELRLEARKLCEENERLKARVAELEAALDANGCDDCGNDCEDCNGGENSPETGTLRQGLPRPEDIPRKCRDCDYLSDDGKGKCLRGHPVPRLGCDDYDRRPSHHCDRCGADFDAPVDHGDGWDRCPECGTN